MSCSKFSKSLIFIPIEGQQVPLRINKDTQEQIEPDFLEDPYYNDQQNKTQQDINISDYVESENSSVYPDYNEDSDIIENISDINMGALSGENPPAPPSNKINETQKSTIAEKMMSICKSLMEMSRELNSSLIIKENWLPTERDLQENIKEIIEENIIE